jgi:hypothetical protein
MAEPPSSIDFLYLSAQRSADRSTWCRSLLIFMALLFRTRPPWPRQPRACVNGARYDIISLLGRSVTLVTFHSVDASEIDCCVPRGHGC